MPTFIDHHATMPDLPPEAQEQIASRTRSGEPDEFGVKGLNVFMGDGQAFCLSEAPDADAVVRAHEAAGFPLRREDVVQVESVV